MPPSRQGVLSAPAPYQAQVGVEGRVCATHGNSSGDEFDFELAMPKMMANYFYLSEGDRAKINAHRRRIVDVTGLFLAASAIEGTQVTC